ncbi:MAG: tripartite tricarboxylate transporter substrate binding protein [Betaproteobacteria bacterium]|nr:tripartite tricarboxylate transporter substrate binding protein [Betaproteobacteria bacterium]
MRIAVVVAAVAAGMSGIQNSAVAAERSDYPARPIRIIVPNAPGSTTDLLGRIIFTRMSERLGKQIVVDNRPGAGGTLGMEIASRATPDGYNLAAVAASQLTITPHTYRKIGYDPLRDFLPVGLFVTAQTALCVNANLAAKTVREFIDLAKAKPGQLNMASAGVGSTSHLGSVMFATLAGISANHVPYKGGGPSIASVAQGEAQWTVPPLSAAMPQVRAGRMRCLATGGDRRSPVTPELPTIAESGVPGFRYYGWNGVVAPRATPRPIIVKFNRVMSEVLGAAEVRKLFFDLGEEPVRGSPEDFGKLIREDYERMGKLVKLAGIRPE